MPLAWMPRPVRALALSFATLALLTGCGRVSEQTADASDAGTMPASLRKMNLAIRYIADGNGQRSQWFADVTTDLSSSDAEPPALRRVGACVVTDTCSSPQGEPLSPAPATRPATRNFGPVRLSTRNREYVFDFDAERQAYNGAGGEWLPFAPGDVLAASMDAGGGAAPVVAKVSVVRATSLLHLAEPPAPGDCALVASRAEDLRLEWSPEDGVGVSSATALFTYTPPGGNENCGRTAACTGTDAITIPRELVDEAASPARYPPRLGLDIESTSVARSGDLELTVTIQTSFLNTDNLCVRFR